MPIQVDPPAWILKDDIAEALRANGCAEWQYINTKPDCRTAVDMKHLLSNAVWIPLNSLPDDLYVKTISIPGKSEIKKDIDISAKFDSLVSMFAKAFIPASNIRYCKFTFLEQNPSDKTFGINTYYKNVSLVDKAICGTNAEQYANNINEYSKEIGILNTEQLFLDNAGDLKSKLNTLKSNLVRQTYNHNINAVPVISTGTLTTLSNLFIDGLNYIRTSLSCEFKDDAESHTCTLNFYKEDNGGSIVSSFNEMMYSYFTIPNYFWPDPDNSFQGWSLQKNSGTVQFENPNKYLVLANTSFYPVLARTVTYNVPYSSIPGAFTAKSKSAINAVSRNDYVKSKRRIDDTKIEEKVAYNTTDFYLPSSGDLYFKYDSDILKEEIDPKREKKIVDFIGWKKTSPGTPQEYLTYKTDLLINKDYTFVPLVSISVHEKPPDNVYDERNVDLRITNNRNATYRDPFEDQYAEFDFEIPLAGQVRAKKTTGFTLAIPIDDLGFKLKGNINPNYVKKLTLSVKVTGNTEHKGYYQLKMVQCINGGDKTVYGPTDVTEFMAGETARNQDNFGIEGNQWAFVDKNTATYTYTFKFDTGKTDLQNSYIKFWGRTGYSTDDKNGYYAYRCRALITIDEITVGTIN